jgi:hypothetical protein
MKLQSSALSAFILSVATLVAVPTAATAAGPHTVPGVRSHGARSLDARTPTIQRYSCGDGSGTQAIRPAPGFNPLTASSAELLANGFPLRPSKPSTLRLWRHFVMHRRVITRCPGVSAHTNITEGQVSENWAGNVADGDTYTEAYGEWTVPKANSTGKDTTAYASSWVGIGQGDSKAFPLVQAGTESNYTGSSHYTIWHEVYPQEATAVNYSFSVSAGDTIWVDIKFTESGVATMEASDFSNDKEQTTVDTLSGSQPDATAEWILERPGIKKTSTEEYLYPLDTSTTNFADAGACGINGGGYCDGLYSAAHYWVEMTDCEKTDYLAVPGAINDESDFSDVWKQYGHKDTVYTSTVTCV